MPVYELDVTYKGARFPNYRGKQVRLRLEAPEGFQPTPQLLMPLIEQRLAELERRDAAIAQWAKSQQTPEFQTILRNLVAKPKPAPPKVPEVTVAQQQGIRAVPKTTKELGERLKREGEVRPFKPEVPIPTPQELADVERRYFSVVSNWLGFKPTIPQQWLDQAKRMAHSGMTDEQIDAALAQAGLGHVVRAIIMSEVSPLTVPPEGWLGKALRELDFNLWAVSKFLSLMPRGLAQLLSDSATLISYYNPDSLTSKRIKEAAAQGDKAAQNMLEDVESAKQRFKVLGEAIWGDVKLLIPHSGWTEHAKKKYAEEGIVPGLIAAMIVTEALGLAAKGGALTARRYVIRDFEKMAQDILRKPMPMNMSERARAEALQRAFAEKIREAVSKREGREISMQELASRLKGKTEKDVARLLHPQAVDLADALARVGHRLDIIEHFVNPLYWLNVTEQSFNRAMQQTLGVPGSFWERFYNWANEMRRRQRLKEEAKQGTPPPKEQPPTGEYAMEQPRALPKPKEEVPKQEPAAPAPEAPPAPRVEEPPTQPVEPSPPTPPAEPAPSFVWQRIELRPEQIGKESEAYTAKGKAVKTKYAVVDVNELITSHSIFNWAENADYPEVLQPRDRSSAVMQQQVKEMASQLKPPKLGESASTSTGAPIVGADGFVESGNGRTLALMLAYRYELESAEQYRQWLLMNAEQFGLNPSYIYNIRNPILVRIREPEEDMKTRAELVLEMGLTDVATFSSVERALADARRLQNFINLYKPEESLNSANNKRFVLAFMQGLPTSELNELLMPGGELSRTGEERIMHALLAYGYPNYQLLLKMMESRDLEIKRIFNAIAASAPDMAKLKATIEMARRRGFNELADAYDISEDIAAAAMTMEHIRATGRKVPEILQQSELFSDYQLPYSVKAILAAFDTLTSLKQLKIYFDTYADMASRVLELATSPDDLLTASMLEAKRNLPSKEKILLNAKSAAQGEGTLSLFEVESEIPELPTAEELAQQVAAANEQAAQRRAKPPKVEQEVKEGAAQPTKAEEEVATPTAEVEPAVSQEVAPQAASAQQAVPKPRRRRGKKAQQPVEQQPVAEPEPTAQEAREGEPLPREEQELKVSPPEPEEPVEGAPSVESLEEIMNKLRRHFRVGRLIGKRLGQYDPAAADIVIRKQNDLVTFAHEVAHALDDEHRIVPQWEADQANINTFDEELDQFVNKSRKFKNLREKRKEALASFFEVLLLDNKYAVSHAPQFYTFLRNLVDNPDFWDDWYEFATAAQRWIRADAPEKVTTHFAFDKPPVAEAAPGTFRIHWVDQMVKLLIDDRWPAIKAWREALRRAGLEDVLPEENFEVLISLWAGRFGTFEEILRNGVPLDFAATSRSRSFIDLLKTLDTSSWNNFVQDCLDLFGLMASQRAQELLERKKAEVYNRLRKQIKLKEIKGAEAADDADILRKIDEANQVGNRKWQELYEAANAEIENYRSRITGWGGGIFPDDEIAVQFIQSLQNNQPEKYNRLLEAAAIYREIADALLEYAVAGGRLSKDKADQIRESNQFYVDFHRVFGLDAPRIEATSSSNISRVRSLTWKIKGSTRRIHNPIVTLMESVARITSEVMRNKAMQEFVRVLRIERDMYQGEPVLLADIGRQVEVPSDNTVTVYVNGEEQLWEFHPDVRRAFDAWNDMYVSEGWNAFVWIFGGLANIAYHGVILAPIFAVRNFFRDLQERLIRSPFGGVLPKLKERERWKLRGGSQAGFYHVKREEYYKIFTTLIEELVRKPNVMILLPVSWLKRAGRSYTKKILQTIEESGRIAIYNKAMERAQKKMGYDQLNSEMFGAIASRQHLDFRVAGALIRVINRFVPFTSASVRALSMALDALIPVLGTGAGGFGGRGKGGTPKGAGDMPWEYRRWGIPGLITTPHRALATWVRLFLYGYLLSQIIRWWNQRDKEVWEEYQEFTPETRHMFWLIHTPLGWLGIPKAYEYGVIGGFGDAVVDDTISDWARVLARIASPVDESSLALSLSGLLGAIANYDFFRGRWIVPPYEYKRALFDDFGDVALESALAGSPLARAIGLKINVNPLYIDYVLRQQLGHMGALASEASRVAAGEREAVSLLKQITGLTRTPTPYTSKSVQEAIKRAQETNRLNFAEMQGLREHIKEWFRLHRAGKHAEAKTELKLVRKQAKAALKSVKTPYKAKPRPSGD